MFKNPDIYSSYNFSEMGKVLYDAVLESKPKIIVDFGLLYGYSTVCLGMAAKIIGSKVYAYDIFDDYKFNKSSREIVQQNIIKHDLEDVVVVEKRDFNVWVKHPDPFDLLHVDISNTGEIVELLYDNLKNKKNFFSRVFFEGGSPERDQMDWMLNYNKKPFSAIREDIKYFVLKSDNYVDSRGRTISPSISELFF